jgi:hypothetical protein
LSAVCFWGPDLRMIPTFVARMSQIERDACATLVLINALQGVSMKRGTSAPQARPEPGDRLDPGWVHSWRVPNRTRRVV